MNIIKTASAVLRNHRCAAAVVAIIPVCVMLLTAAAEYLLLIYFFPFVTAKVKYTIIVSAILVLDIIILWPLSIGKKRWNYKLFVTGESIISGMFYYYSSFKNFFSSVTLMLLKRLYLAAVSIVCLVPGVSLYKYFTEKNLNDSGVMLSIFAIIIGALFIIKSCLSLFLCDYYFIEKCRNPFKAFGTGLLKMRHHRIDLLLLLLRFWWRILLCVFVFPLLYVVPLISQSAVIYALRVTDSTDHSCRRESPADSGTANALKPCR